MQLCLIGLIIFLIFVDDSLSSNIQAEILQNKEVVAIEGENVVLSCERVSQMAVTTKNKLITWTNPTAQVLFANGEGYLKVENIELIQDLRYDLSIKRVRWEDRGKYTCVYYGDKTYKIIIDLQVKVPPKFIDTSDDEVIDEGGSIALQCVVEGKPEPNVSWRFIMPQGLFSLPVVVAAVIIVL